MTAGRISGATAPRKPLDARFARPPGPSRQTCWKTGPSTAANTRCTRASSRGDSRSVQLCPQRLPDRSRNQLHAAVAAPAGAAPPGSARTGTPGHRDWTAPSRPPSEERVQVPTAGSGADRADAVVSENSSAASSRASRVAEVMGDQAVRDPGVLGDCAVGQVPEPRVATTWTAASSRACRPSP